MNKFCLRFRFFLIMFALGLASVSFFNRFYEQQTGISVNLPQTAATASIFVHPIAGSEMPNCFGIECSEQTEPLSNTNNSLTDSDTKIYTVGFCDVFREPKRYDGKIIRTEVFYDQGIDTSALSGSQCKEWMRPYCHNSHKQKCGEAFNRIEKAMESNQSNRARVDIIGRYTDDIVDRNLLQNGYRIHLFEIIELKTVRPAKFNKTGF